MSKVLPIEIRLDKGNSVAVAASFRGDMKKLNRDVLTDSEAAERAKLEMLRKANKERVDGAVKAAEEEKKGWGITEESVLSAVKAVGSFSAGMLGLSGASQAVGVVVDHFREVNRSIFEAGKFVEGYRKALLELAALKGGIGTTQAIGQDLDLRAKTLQTKEDATAFQAKALGVGQSAIDTGLISSDEAKRARELGGSFQAWEGGSADTHGALTGIIPQLLGRKTTGNEVAQKESQLFNIFQAGGPSFTSLTNQYLKSVAPLTASKTLDPMKGASLLSAFSTTNMEGAGSEVEQFMRGTLGGIDKTSKGKIKSATPQGEYYKSIGITDDLLKGTKPQEQAFMIADKIMDDVVKHEKAANEKGDEFSRRTYLTHKGFGNQEDAAALAHYIGLKETGQMGTFMDLAKDSAMPSIAEIESKNTRKQNTEPALQGRKADYAEEAAKVAVGAGKQEFVTNVQRVAFARRKARGETSGEYGEDLQNRWTLDPREMMFGERHKTEMESQRMLLEEAQRLGIETPKVSRQKMSFAPGAPATELGEEYLGPDALFQLGQRINAAGGSAIPGVGQVTAAAKKSLGRAQAFEGGGGAGNGEMVDLMKEQNELLGKLVNGGGPPKPLVQAPWAMAR